MNPLDDHRCRLVLGEAAAAQIKQLLVGDLVDDGLVRDRDVRVLDLDVRPGVAVDLSSIIRPSHWTRALEPCEFLPMRTRPR